MAETRNSSLAGIRWALGTYEGRLHDVVRRIPRHLDYPVLRNSLRLDWCFFYGLPDGLGDIKNTEMNDRQKGSPPEKSECSFALQSKGTSDQFSEKHKRVFDFTEVTIKKQSNRADGTSKQEDNSEGYPVKPADFKGRESLFRVPENEDWQKPVRDKFARFRDRNPDDRFVSRPGSRDDRNISRSGDGATFRKPSSTPRTSGWRRLDRKEPDFKVNPHKYTRYSLEDTDVTTNRENSQAAFAFLREMDSRKRKANDSPGQEELQAIAEGKINFKKPTVAAEKQKEPSEKSLKDESGMKAKKRKEMTLSHLVEDDGIDDED